MKNKNLVTAFILGALFVIFLYHAYTVYQVRAVTIQNSAQIAEIVTYLNGGSQPTSTPTPVVTPEVSEEE